MRPSLLRILLGIEYLIAVQVLIAFWSHAGGQYHLDLMFWPWKLVLPLVGAALVVAITSGLAGGLRWRSARILLMMVSLALLMVVAGFVTYYYHMNEPADQDDQDQPAQITRTHLHTVQNASPGGRLYARADRNLPGPAGFGVANHGSIRFASERLLKLRHVGNHAIDPEFRK
jgi:nitrogen fixation-related uncharacterized protein